MPVPLQPGHGGLGLIGSPRTATCIVTIIPSPLHLGHSMGHSFESGPIGRAEVSSARVPVATHCRPTCLFSAPGGPSGRAPIRQLDRILQIHGPSLYALASPSPQGTSNRKRRNHATVAALS